MRTRLKKTLTTAAIAASAIGALTVTAPAASAHLTCDHSTHTHVSAFSRTSYTYVKASSYWVSYSGIRYHHHVIYVESWDLSGHIISHSTKTYDCSV